MKSDFPRIKPVDWGPPLIAVVGMGTCPGDLGECAREWIDRAEALVGGRRHLDLFPDHTGDKVALGSPLSEHLDLVGQIATTRRTAVLASGDPLFFGIGKRLGEKFGRDRLIIIPGVTSLQVLCARLRLPWGDVETVSLHGREENDAAAIALVVEKLLLGVKAAIFTDPKHTPRWIGSRLADSGVRDCSVIVGENLGGPVERIREMTPGEAANETFSDLNLVLVLPPASVHRDPRGESGVAAPQSIGEDPGAGASCLQGTSAPAMREGHSVRDARHSVLITQSSSLITHHSGPEGGSNQVFGFCESCFEREAGLITKMEIRAVALALLRLGPGQVLWDIGAGTGSISVEAARIAPLKSVYAVEKNKARFEKLLGNIRKFGASVVEAVSGGAPEALDGLAAPDRVFIGGSGNALPEILEAVSKRLLPGGGVVHTIVLLDTLEKVKNFWAGRRFDVSLTQLQVSRSAPLGKDLRLEALNPVFIVSAWRR